MKWKQLKPIKQKMSVCLSREELIQKAPMDMEISLEFGIATVTKDGEIFYSEEKSERVWTVADAEKEASKDQDHDWRIYFAGELRGRMYQRQGEGKWVLVKEYGEFS